MVAVRASLLIAFGAIALVSCGSGVDDVATSGPVLAPSVAAATATAPPVVAAPTAAATTTDATEAIADPDEFRGPQPGSFYFVTATSKFECGILVQVEAIAGCHGELPSSAPPVPSSGAPSETTAPNAIKVSGDTAGKFYSAGDPQFHRFEGAAPVLPYGETLVAGGFTCSVDETSGVTCESKAGHGFTVSDSAYDVW